MQPTTLRNLFAVAAGAIPSHPLTCRQAALLCAIGEQPGLSTGEYATQIGVTPPVVTRSIYSLAEHDLVVSRRSALDCRKVVLNLTAKGRKALNALAAAQPMAEAA